MKKVIKTGWLVIGIASVIVGTYLLFTEPLAYSKFYVFYITALLAFLLDFGGSIWKRTPKNKRKAV